jgi:hypothetical protein
MCSTLDCPHYERLNCLFASTIKIVGIPQGVDQGVHTIHREFKRLNFSNDDDSSNHEAQDRPTVPKMQMPTFGNGFVPPTFSSNTPRTKACKLFGVQG